MTKVGADMSTKVYSLHPDDNDPRYFPLKGVEIRLKGKKIGSMGVLHPEVLNNFEIKYPVSCLEIDFQPLFDHLLSNQ